MRVMKSAGWSAEVLATGGPGDARSLAEYGVAEGVDVVAVFGGDGTTMQAAAALVGTDVALGVIPGGTGNLLAGNLRIPPAPARAARALVARGPEPFDLGRMERPGGPHYFAVACGAGYDARVMAEHAVGAQAALGDGGLRRDHAPPDQRDPEHRPRHHHRRRGVRRQCRDGAGGELRRGDPALRPAAARASAPTTGCSTWWSCGPTASGRASAPCGTCSGWPPRSTG